MSIHLLRKMGFVRTYMSFSSPASAPAKLQVNGIESFAAHPPDNLDLLWQAVGTEEKYRLQLRVLAPSKAERSFETVVCRGDRLEIPFPREAFPVAEGEEVLWRVRSACSDEGAWSREHRFAIMRQGLEPARWITGEGYQFARKEFHLCRREGATLWLATAPHLYVRDEWEQMEGEQTGEAVHSWLLGGTHVKARVWINGELITVRYARGISRFPLLEAIDATPYLHEGKNVLAVLFFGETRGFAAQLEGREGGFSIVTDGSWKTRSAADIHEMVAWERPALDHFFKGFTGPGERSEHIRGDRYPWGWNEPGFPDKEWCAAAADEVAVGPFESIGLPQFGNELLVPALQQHSSHTAFDYGQQVFGSLCLSWEKESQDGQSVEIRLGEELRSDHRVRYVWRTENTIQERWIASNNSRPLEHFGLRPFRYGELLPAQRGVNVAVRSALYPFDSSAARFACSNPSLEKVWRFCKETIAASNSDLYTDCLSRERIAYEADCYVSMLSHFALDADFALARRTLDYLITHSTWPQEWQLLMPVLLWEEYCHTGNPRLWQRHFHTLLQRVLDSADWHGGLGRAFRHRVIVDWPLSLRDDYDFDGDTLAVPNAYLYEALRRLADGARLLGDHITAHRLEADAQRLRAEFRRRLLDPAHGLCRDHPTSTHTSFHASVAAARFGLLDEAESRVALGRMSRRELPCSPFFAQLYLEALFACGMAEEGCRVMLEEPNRNGWLMMLDGHGASTTMEVWHPQQKANLSWAHPWATAPVNIISRWVAGIRPSTPGWASVSIRPQLGSLERLSLRLPTPRGPLHLEVARKFGAAQIIRCDLPTGVRLHPAPEAPPHNINPPQRAAIV